jgi:hypothetical protein
MEERRRLKRKYLAFFTRVFDRTSGELVGHLADLSSGGMMVISEEPIHIEQDLELRMDLAGPFFDKEHLDYSARSRWCLPDINPNFWNTGFMITDIAEEDRQTLERIIEEFGIRD